MSQQNQGTASPAEVQTRRKRGRPRKGESQSSPRTPVPSTASIQGEGSSAVRPTASIPSKGKESIEAVDEDDDDDQEYDEMVGKTVTGVLEYAFDAGYFLSVKVENSNLHMRGVVFKEECIVPVTPENDIAPNVKMHKRKAYPISALNASPRVAEQTARDSSLKPAVNIDNQQQVKVSFPTVTWKEQLEAKAQQMKGSDDKEKPSDDKEEQGKLSDGKEQEKLSDDKKVQEKLADDKEAQEKLADDKEEQEKLSDDKEMQEKLSDDKEVQDKLSDDKEEQQKLSVGDGINEEGSAKKESLKDLSEPATKRQKTDNTTVSHSNKEDIVPHDALINEDAFRSVEEAHNTGLPKELFRPFHTDIPMKDSSIFFPPVIEQDDVSEFQISMENPDDDDELSEQPNDITPMETEQEENTD